MKALYSISLFYTIFLLTGCKSDESTTPINNDPVMPIVNSIGQSTTIEVVTWNIEHFPKAEFTSEYVKAIIEGLDADIFMLQEIESSTKFGSMLDDMDNYNYIMQATRTNLNLVLIYNSDLINVKSSSELFIDDDHFFAGRPPLLTKLEWQKNGITKELTIINLHLKCCGDNSIDIDNNDDEEYRRVVACQMLHDYVSGSLNSENVIIVGDWNDAIQEVDSTNVFKIFINNPDNFKFVDMDIANSDASNWSWQGWNSSWPAIHFDHILINNNLFDEFDNSSVVDIVKLEEYFPNGVSEYDNNVSDHRPVYIKFTP